MAAIVAAAWTTIALVFAAQDYLLARYVGRPMAIHRVILGVAPHYVLWALLALPIVWLAARFPIDVPIIGRRIVIHLALCVVFYAIDIAISAVIMPLLITEGPPLTKFLLGVASIRTFYDDFLLYWGIVGVSHLIRYQERLSAEQGRRAELQREFTVAQLNALRAQLQPHFLFNTLNSISELMRVDVEAADRMIDSLSSLLRSSLECEAQQIALAEELQMLDIYLEIQQVRFSDSVSIELAFESDVLDALVPTLLLQPLVENAFRHGLSRRREHGVVAIGARRADGDVRIDVRDNGGGLPPGRIREGIGLRNTRTRLEQLYGTEHTLAITAAAGGGTQVTVTFPYRSATQAGKEATA